MEGFPDIEKINVSDATIQFFFAAKCSKSVEQADKNQKLSMYFKKLVNHVVLFHFIFFS